MPEDRFVLKLLYTPQGATSGTPPQTRKFAFTGDICHPAVFSGLKDRAQKAFGLEAGTFDLKLASSRSSPVNALFVSRDTLHDHKAFVGIVDQEVKLQLTRSASGPRDEKGRLGIAFDVVPKIWTGLSETARGPLIDLDSTQDDMAPVGDINASHRRATDTSANASENSSLSGQHFANMLAQASRGTSGPFRPTNEPISCQAGPPMPMPPATPLSAIYSPAAARGSRHGLHHHHHHHHRSPHHHHHPHAHHAAPAPQPATPSTLEATQKPSSATTPISTVFTHRVEQRRLEQEKLQRPAVIAPSPVQTVSLSGSNTSSYQPSYTSSVPSPAALCQDGGSPKAKEAEIKAMSTSPAKEQQESWSGVKGLIKTFVHDLNRHLADKFGDEAAGFELRLAGSEQSEQAKQAAPPANPASTIVHKNVFCDLCLKTIRGARYKCASCSNYDRCAACLTKTPHDSTHAWVEIGWPGAKGVPLSVNIVGESEKAKEQTTEPETKEPVRHHAFCDDCQQDIIGVRYKCLTCPDYDLDEQCYASRGHSIHPSHSFVAITDPSQLKSRHWPQSRAESTRPAHPHIACDSCGASPIVGPRYHCTHPSCDDFDLCEECEADPVPRHDVTHAMLKMKRPMGFRSGGERGVQEATRRARDVLGLHVGAKAQQSTAESPAEKSVEGGGEGADALAHIGGKVRDVLMSLATAASRAGNGYGNEFDFDFGSGERKVAADLPSWAKVAQVVPGPGKDTTVVIDVDLDAASASGSASGASDEQEQRQAQTTSRTQEDAQSLSAGVTPTASSDAVETLVVEAEAEHATGDVTPKEESCEHAVPTEDAAGAAEVPGVSLRANFVADITLTDGSIVPAGGEFLKMWLVRNSGSSAWPAGTTLINVGGFSHSSAAKAKAFDVFEAKTGEEVEVLCELKAPEEPGHYMDFWRLQAPNGELFGDRFWVDIVVASVEGESQPQSFEVSSSSQVQELGGSSSSFVAPAMQASGELVGGSGSSRATSTRATTEASVAGDEAVVLDRHHDGELELELDVEAEGDGDTSAAPSLSSTSGAPLSDFEFDGDSGDEFVVLTDSGDDEEDDDHEGLF